MQSWLELMEQRASAMRCMSFFVNSSLARGWASWRELVSDNELLARGLSYLTNRELSRSFGAKTTFDTVQGVQRARVLVACSL